MADESNNLGDLTVNITGDFSELQGALDDATSAAQSASADISSALQGIVDASGLAGGDLALFKSVLEGDQEAGIALSQSLEDLSNSAATVGETVAGAAAAALEQLQQSEETTATSADQLTSSLEDEAGAASDVAQHAGEAESGLAAMAEKLVAVGEALVVTEGLKELGQEALNAFGTVQSVTIGLTQLTGSAQSADEIITQIKELAATEPFAFPEIAPTVQKMVALGVSAEQIPGIMQAAADAAAATGNSFQQVANAIDRMSLSGAANARQLVALGLSATDLGAAMGVAADEVTKAFKALDQQERLDVLQSALEKFAGSAEAQAQGIAGQWQIFKNSFEEVMVAVGDDLAPAVSAILSFGKTVLGVVQSAAEAFKELPQPVQDVALAIGLAAAAAVPLTAALSVFGLALAGVNTLIPSFVGLMQAVGVVAAEDATAETGAAAATTAHGTAAGAASARIEALAAAETVQAGAAETAAVSTGELGAAATGTGAAVEAAGVSLAAWAGIAAVAVVGLAAVIGGVKDAISSFEGLKTEVSAAASIFQETGGAAGLFAQALNTVGVSTEKAGAAIEALEPLVEKLGAAVSSSITDEWYLFENEMTGHIPLAIDTTKAALDALATKMLGMPFSQFTAGLNQIKKAMEDAFGGSTQVDLSTALSFFTPLSAGAQKVADEVGKLKDAVTAANAVVVELGNDLKNGTASTDEYNAAVVNLNAAQKALANALGNTTAAAKPLADSIAALKQAQDQADNTYDTAYLTFQKLATAYGQGKTTVDGLQVSLGTLATAWDNVAKASLNATGQVVPWINNSANLDAVLKTVSNETVNLQSNVDKWTAAQKALQGQLQDTITNGGNVVSVMGQLKIVTDNLTAAQAAQAKATQVSADQIGNLSGISENAYKFLQDGKEVTLSNVDADGKWTGALNDLIDKLTAAGVVTQNAANAAKDTTVAFTDQANATYGVAQASGDASTAIQDLLKKGSAYITDSQTLVININDQTDAFNQLAAAADAAGSAVGNAGKAGGGGGAGGASMKEGAGNEQDMGNTAISWLLSGNPLESQFVVPGSLSFGGLTGSDMSGYSTNNLLQQLADSTNQVINSIYGEFVPASITSAEIAKQTAAALAAENAAQQKATAAQTANTTAVVASTTAMVAALTAAQTAFISSASAGDTIVTSFGALPVTIQDFLDSVGGTLVAYDDTTGALQYTTQSADGLAQTMTAGTAANQLSTTATQAATTATSSLATAASQAAAATTATTTGLVSLAGAVTTAAAASSAAFSAVSQGLLSLLTTNGPAATGVFGTTQSGTGGSFASGNLSDIPGLNSTVGNGLPPIVLNISGNTVASDSSIQMLANKVASALTTQLRTVAGLKF